ncbi:MAG: hypothetical protein R3F11_17930 [Verrucomicrobiales bacterium]
MEARGLEQDRGAAKGRDLIHLRAVEVDEIAFHALDVGSGDEAFARAERLPRPAEDHGAFGGGRVVGVAGIHVHRAGKPRLIGAADRL